MELVGMVFGVSPLGKSYAMLRYSEPSVLGIFYKAATDTHSDYAAKGVLSAIIFEFFFK